jgi:hypothetical protein
MLKKPILKIKLNTIFENVSTCTKSPILQNGLDVDETLIFKNIQIDGAQK